MTDNDEVRDPSPGPLKTRKKKSSVVILPPRVEIVVDVVVKMQFSTARKLYGPARSVLQQLPFRGFLGVAFLKKGKGLCRMSSVVARKGINLKEFAKCEDFVLKLNNFVSGALNWEGNEYS